ncbi:MAG TPA: hypothetical protein VMG81_03375 [Thermoplasmata archaeon]|nr:hypothetical protein [Thermoplasmata archaeon]
MATLTSGADGKTNTAVLGATYDAKLILAAHGGRYDNVRKYWTFEDPEAATKAVGEANAYFVMRAARRNGSA